MRKRKGANVSVDLLHICPNTRQEQINEISSLIGKVFKQEKVEIEAAKLNEPLQVFHG